MAESPQVASHNRALRLGYRLRWLYLALVVFGAIVWWGMWPGDSYWYMNFSDEVNPVLRMLDLVAFYWMKGDEAWFSYDAGFDAVWGYEFSFYGRASTSDWVWWGCFSFGVPALLITLIVGFLGIRKNTTKLLPAKRQLSGFAFVCVVLANSMMLGGVAVMVLHLTGVLKLWEEAAQQVSNPQNLFAFSKPTLFSWPPHIAWILILAFVPSAVMLWFLIVRRETYWQLECVTRWIAISSGILLTVALIAGITGRFDDGYYALYITVWRTVWFSASTALLWAAACRVWLLFRLVKYEKQRVAMMTESPVCFACEYDLSGSLRGGVRRCPECGVAVPGEVVERFSAAAATGSGGVETEGAGVGE